MLKTVLTAILLFFSFLSFSQTWKELNDSVRFYMERGEFENSIGFGQKLLTLIKEEFGEDHRFYAGSLNNLGSMYQQLGRYEKAEPLFIESLQIRKRLGTGTGSDLALGTSNLASFYEGIGQYEKAEALYLEATAIWKNALGGEHPYYATSLHNLSGLYQSMGQTTKAQSFLKEATEIRKKVLGDTHPDFGRSLVAVAGMLAIQGDYKVADLAFNRAADILKKALGEKHPDYVNCLKQQAAFYELAGELEKAEAQFIEVIRIEKELFKAPHPSHASSLRNLAELYLKMGKPLLAEPLLLENSKIVLNHLQNNFIAFSAIEKINYISNNVSLLEVNNSYVFNFGKASASILQNNLYLQLVFKSMVLDEAKNVFQSAQTSSDSEVQDLLRNWKSNKRLLARQYALPVPGRRPDIDSIETRTENLEKMLSRRSAAFRKQQDLLVTSLGDIQKNLKRDEVAIEFVKFRLYNKKWTDSIIYAAYIFRKENATPLFVPLFEESQLGKILDSAGTDVPVMVSKLYRGLGGKNNSNAITDRTELYKLIWSPLEPYLKAVKTIHYSPAGRLYSIALHALPVDSTTILMDKYAIRQYTNLKSIAVTDSLDRGSMPRSAILFGDPVFSLDSQQLFKQKQMAGGVKPAVNITTPVVALNEDSLWTQLPGTALEIKKLGQLFTANKIVTKTFTQLAASEEQLKDIDGHAPQILHIATHGFFLPERSKEAQKAALVDNTYRLANDPLLRSGLVLTGGNYAWSGKTPIEGVEDGIVTSYEISQLDLSGTDLLVLSACETALGDIKGAEGVFGLQRAFKLAGVKKMIVSLWQVPDKETVELMTAFYSYYIKGKTIEEAFSKAQAQMREKYSAFYWAAFVLVQ